MRCKGVAKDFRMNAQDFHYRFNVQSPVSESEAYSIPAVFLKNKPSKLGSSEDTDMGGGGGDGVVADAVESFGAFVVSPASFICKTGF